MNQSERESSTAHRRRAYTRRGRNPLIFLENEKRYPRVACTWTETESHPESIILAGTIGDRVGKLLRRYSREDDLPKQAARFICHDVAWYAAGIRERLRPVAPIYIGILYELLEIQPIIPGDTPALIHLIDEELRATCKKWSYLLYQCPHSALHLGRIDGHDIAFWKNGSGAVHLTTTQEMVKGYERATGRFLTPMAFSPATIKERAAATGMIHTL